MSASVAIEPKPEILPSSTLLTAVKEYLKISQRYETKLVVLVEEALKMLKTMKPEDVTGAFRESYAIANDIKAGEFGDNPGYAAFRMMTIRVVKVAKQGREWFDKHRAQGMTVNAMFEFAKEESASEESESESGDTGSKSGKKTKASKVDPATKMKIRGDGPWFARCRYIVKNEQDAFVKMLKEVGGNVGVPEPLIEEFIQYIMGER